MIAASGTREPRRLLPVARTVAAAALSLTLTTTAESSTASDQTALFRIGTGGLAGSYYPVGSVLAAELTDRLGVTCRVDCPAQPLFAVAQTSNGSVSNIAELAARRLEAGLVQADIAHWAYSGEGIFSNGSPMQELRAIGHVYSESLQIVARADTGIRALADLRGKRVSLDEQGSGTLIAARLVLEAHGLTETDLEPRYVKPDLAIQKLRAGTLDAFFTVAGAPTASITALADDLQITLVPIEAAAQAELASRVPFFLSALLPAGLYRGTEPTKSLKVGALMLTRADLNEELVYQVTSVLWHDDTYAALQNGGAPVRRDMALNGLPLPLHSGAKRFYRETGLLR
ncbi:TAXI family TRAP transporter solute-binding subunit [Algihabitans albus]|uniref:TAXI family TRAP transporter solute-binding subunit n=1 Tax=Algihabitans albus TaxID=2164067 RepID=UPI0035D10D7A